MTTSQPLPAGNGQEDRQHPIDVTELERLREAVRVSEDGSPVELDDAQSGIFLRELFRQAPSPIVVFRGKDHVFDMANEAYFSASSMKSPKPTGRRRRCAKARTGCRKA